MGQITTGIRAVLSTPWVYDLLQSIMGDKKRQVLFCEKFIRPFSEMQILDIGCGTAKILDALPEDVAYTGFDVSPVYIQKAQSRYRHRATFRCEMIEEMTLEGLHRFDVVLAKGVLHHLNDDDAKKLVGLAYEALKPGGRFISIDGVYIPKQNRIAKFLLDSDRGQNVRTHQRYLNLIPKDFNSVTSTIQHTAFIPYTHCIMVCTR